MMIKGSLLAALLLAYLNGSPLLVAASLNEEGDVRDEYTLELPHSNLRNVKGLPERKNRILKGDGE
jgi:hypothetical protein